LSKPLSILESAGKITSMILPYPSSSAKATSAGTTGRRTMENRKPQREEEG
jgi:hypothetical protein